MTDNNLYTILSTIGKHEEQLGKVMVVLERQEMALAAMKAAQQETDQKVQAIADFLKGVCSPRAVETPGEVVGQTAQEKDSGLIRGMEQLSVRAGVPHKFAGGEGEDLDSWIFKMERLFHKIGVKEEEVKLDLACEGLEGTAFQFFQIQARAGKLMSWTQLTMDLKRRFNHLKSPMQLRLKLQDVKLETSLEKYVNEFLELVNRIPDMSESESIVAFMGGLSGHLQKRMMQEKPNSLEEAVEIAFVNFVKNEGRTGGKSNRVEQEAPRNHNRIEAKGRSIGSGKCHNCGEFGHFKRDCPRETKKTLQVNLCQDKRGDLVGCRAKLEGEPVEVIFDTAATVSVISTRVAKRLGLPLDGTVNISTALGEGRVPRTKALRVEVCGSVVEMSVVVTDMENDMLLGLDWAAKTGAFVIPVTRRLVFPLREIALDTMEEVVKVGEGCHEEVFLTEVQEMDPMEWHVEEDMSWDFTPGEMPQAHTNECMDAEDVQETNRILEENRACFCESIMGLGNPQVEPIEIHLKTQKPVYKAPFRKSRKETETLRLEIEKMLEAKIIRPSKSAYGAPAFAVGKPDKSARIVVDYRGLNALMDEDRFPMPRVDDILDRLGDAKVFTVLDCKAGYWQLPLAKSTIPKTAFTTPFGHFEYLRMPFGLKNAPAEFNRIMRSIFGQISHVEVYLDDIIIHSKTAKEHQEHLRNVFEALKKVGLKLNPKKAQIAVDTVKVLGHVVSGGKVMPSNEKIEAVKRMEPPRTVKALQKYLGLAGYYRRFVKDFAKIACVLYRLCKKDAVWTWDKECQEAFEKLKEALITKPVLAIARMDKPFKIYCDASGFAIGGILAQDDPEGREHVVEYFSRKLKGAEVHYGITEKECLAVVASVMKFKPYVYGEKFEVITDHAALKWLTTLGETGSGRLVRWALYLQAFDYQIRHRPGTLHANVDALSRIEEVVYAVRTTEVLSEEEVVSSKGLDPWEDEALLYYLKHRRHASGLPKKQVKRVKKLANQYVLEDGILYFRKKSGNTEIQLIVPKVQDRTALIKKAHLLGHFQEESTQSRLKEKYHWPKMAKDVAACIRNCLACIRNRQGRTLEHPAKSLEVTGIFDRIGIDCVFGFPIDEEGNVGVLVITEYLSKYPMVFPLKSKTAEEIAKHLWSYISLFGPPKEILSDQGREFVNGVIDALLKKTGVERRVTSPYHPRTNGLTERFNRTLVEALRTQAEEDPCKWVNWIEYVLLAYRSRENSSTKFTPFELVFGRSMNTFEDWRTQPGEDEIAALRQRAYQIKTLCEGKHKRAKEHILEAQEKSREAQNQRAGARLKNEHLEVGSKVYLRTGGLRR